MHLHEVADQFPYMDIWVDSAAHWIISSTMITGGTVNSSDGENDLNSIFRSSPTDDLVDWNSGVCPSVHKNFFRFPSNLVCG